ncbi:hypothetical protein Peur_021323 [Populus x canadensis]
MSSEDSDSSVETDTDSSDKTDTYESASDSSAESQLKPSDLGDVKLITPPLSTNDPVRTSQLELPVCTTSKQMSLPSSSETSSSSGVPTTDLPKMTPSRARPPESLFAAQSVGFPAPTTVPVPIPILDKGKHIAIDPIHNQHMIPDPYPSASTSGTTPLFPIINTLPSTTTATSPQSIIAPASLPSLHPLHSGPNVPNAPSPTDSTIHPMEQPHSQPTTQPPTIPNDPTSTAQPNPDCSPILQSNLDPIALNTLLFQPLDTTTCMESKMASLQSQSDASSAIEVSAETSTTSVPPSESHDDSPTPSPKTVRKKKGGRKRKEVKGL